MPKILLITDDAGFASTDRGIQRLAAETDVPLCAEYMIEQEGAMGRAHQMKNVPTVSLGLHFELAGISDADRVELTKTLAAKKQTLGQQEEYQQKARIDARRQLHLFMSEFGRPAHISTHGNFHVDPDDHIMPWWEDLMDELFEGNVPPLQMRFPLVRHNLYKWNTPEYKHDPLSPAEFGEALQKLQTEEVVEFVMHPAIPEDGDASIDMLFTAQMRIADLQAAIDIMQSGVIQDQGFEIVSATDLEHSLKAE